MVTLNADTQNRAGLPRLNLGCGHIQPQGWVNADGSNRARFAARLYWLDRLMTWFGILSPTEFGSHTKILNLLKPLPYRDGTVGAIYAGELWEHFEYPDAERLTHECFRVLADGGVLRVCVPDGPSWWRRYLEVFDAEVEKPRGERDAGRLREMITLYFREICTRKLWLRSMGHTHKWQFDEIQLVDMFERCGFTEVSRMHRHESRIEGVGAVETRYDSFLMVEGVKPPVVPRR
jgi:predicted SAM-dependent methyltransferase